jgi:hypothetical protein
VPGSGEVREMLVLQELLPGLVPLEILHERIPAIQPGEMILLEISLKMVYFVAGRGALSL